MPLDYTLFPRPFRWHTPKVEGYRPIISGKVRRVNQRKRNSWCGSVAVDDCTMFLGHRDTRRDAEALVAKMLVAYTEAHYTAEEIRESAPMCIGLDGGCTCESCTEQIRAVVGDPGDYPLGGEG